MMESCGVGRGKRKEALAGKLSPKVVAGSFMSPGKVSCHFYSLIS